MLTPEQWDKQYTRQATWTLGTRSHLYRRANLLRASRVLDVGSGTGTITEEVAERTGGRVTGVDIDPAMVDFARGRGGRADYRSGDAHDLPFDERAFDVTVCHFLLLWCRDPARAFGEMVRVTRPGGSILICAEPDYGGRIDYPDLPLGRWQAEALRAEGADPFLGRKLRGIVTQPGARHAELGVIPGLWDLATLQAEFDGEWALWEHTLQGRVPAGELAHVKAADQAAIESGERLAFMPVFYALVRV